MYADSYPYTSRNVSVRWDGGTIENGRYLVFLFEATEYEGELASSEEGVMHWVLAEQLGTVNLVGDFEDLVQVMLDENLSEFQYVIDGGKWKVVKK